MDILKKDIIQALSDCHGIVVEACRKTKTPRSTYYLWLKNDPEFAQAVEEIQEEAIDYVEGQLLKKITGVQIGKVNDGQLEVYDHPPSDTAIIFYLKTKGKKRGYVERQEVEQSGSLSITWNEERTYEHK